MDRTLDHLEDDLFQVICYMVTSAANLLQETKAYGPFRLVDATSRLITALENSGVRSARLEGIRTFIELEKYAVMTDEVRFHRFLQQLVLDLVPMMDQPPPCTGSL